MIAALILFLGLALPQPSTPVDWKFSAVLRADGTVEVRCDARLDEGWHVYATELPSTDGPIATSIRITPSASYGAVIALEEPAPKEEYDPNFAMVVRYHAGTPRFVVLLKPATAETFTVKGEVEYMVCNDKTCLPPVVVPFDVPVQAESPKR
jgi:thiol:disulfide interchange protein DsbD